MLHGERSERLARNHWGADRTTPTVGGAPLGVPPPLPVVPTRGLVPHPLPPKERRRTVENASPTQFPWRPLGTPIRAIRPGHSARTWPAQPLDISATQAEHRDSSCETRGQRREGWRQAGAQAPGQFLS